MFALPPSTGEEIIDILKLSQQTNMLLDYNELTSIIKVLTPASSLQGGFPVSISMMVHPKLHISTAMAMFGLDSFFMAAIMSCSQQIKVKKEHYSDITLLNVVGNKSKRIPLEPSSRDFPSTKVHMISLSAERNTFFK